MGTRGLILSIEVGEDGRTGKSKKNRTMYIRHLMAR